MRHKRCFFFLVFAFSHVTLVVAQAFSDSDEEDDPSKNPAVRCIARLLPLHDQYSERAVFFVWVPKHSTKHPAEPTVLGTPGADVDGIRLCPGGAYGTHISLWSLFGPVYLDPIIQLPGPICNHQGPLRSYSNAF